MPKRRVPEPSPGGGAAPVSTASVLAYGVNPLRRSRRVTLEDRLIAMNSNAAAGEKPAGVVVRGTHAVFTCTVDGVKYLFNFNDTQGIALEGAAYPREHRVQIGDQVYPRDGFHMSEWISGWRRPMMERTTFFNGVPDAQPGEGTCYLFSAYCAAIFKMSGNSLDALLEATCNDATGWREFYQSHAGAAESVCGLRL